MFLPTLVKPDKSGRVHICFVGKGGGRQEEREGIPMVGQTGQFLMDTLDVCIRELGLKKSKIGSAFTHIIRDHPTTSEGLDRNPHEEEVSNCLIYLEKDIENLNPRIIVPLGKHATSQILPELKNYSIKKITGHIFKTKFAGKTRIVIPCIHPSDVIMNSSETSLFIKGINSALIHSKKSSAALKHEKRQKKKFTDKGKSVLLEDFKTAQEYLKFLIHDHTGKCTAYDIETKNLNKKFKNRILSHQFATDMETGYVLPWDGKDSPFSQLKDKKNKEREILLQLLIQVFTGKVGFKYWVIHNAKFDFGRVLGLMNIFITSAPIFDTMVATFLLDENRLQRADLDDPFKLQTLCREFLNFAHYDQETKANRGELYKQSVIGSRFVDYAGMDAYVLVRLFHRIIELAREQSYVAGLKKMLIGFYGVTTPLLAFMEWGGLKISESQLKYLQSENSPIVGRITDIEKEFKKNPNAIKANNKLVSKTYKMKPLFKPWMLDLNKPAPQQILFFDIMGLKPTGYGKPNKKTGIARPKCDKEFQQTYETITEVSLFDEYKKMRKLRESYCDSLQELLLSPDCLDNRVRPDYSLWLTKTGRSNCARPNLQQIPRCLTSNNYLFTSEGIIYIGDLVKENQNTKVNTRGNKIRQIESYHTKKIYKAIQINTEHGFQIKGSYDHKFLVLDQQYFTLLWKKLKDIQIGDCLLNQVGGYNFSQTYPKLEQPNIKNSNEKEYTYPTKMNKDLAGLMGHLCAEGHMKNRGNFYYSNRDKELVKDFHKRIKRCFGYTPLVKRDKRDNSYIIDIWSTQISDFLNEAGISYSARSQTHIIPWSILQAPKDCILEFIACFTSGDGNISNRFFRVFSTSKKMMKQMHLILLGLGCHSTFGIYSKQKKTNLPFYGCVSFSEDAECIIKQLPFIKDKSKYLKHETKFVTQTKRRLDLKKFLKNNLIKVGIQKYLDENGAIVEGCSFDIEQTQSEQFTYNYLNSHNYIIDSIKKVFPEQGKIIEEILKNDYVITRVIKKTHKKFKKGIKAFDLSIDKTHSYIANGLVSHNSSGTGSKAKAQKEVKNMFACDSDNMLVMLDYATNEVRWLALMSGDPSLCKQFIKAMEVKNEMRAATDPKEVKRLHAEFKKYNDVHSSTASLMHGVPFEDVTPEMRQGAKGIVFGLMYGMGLKSLCMVLGKDPDSKKDMSYVKGLVKRWFSTFPMAEKWLNSQVTHAEKFGFVETPFHRRRHLPDILSEDGGISAHARNQAKNSPIQATASDTAFLAAGLLLTEYILPRKKSWRIPMIVHDSCTLEIPRVEKQLDVSVKRLEYYFTTRVQEYITNTFDFKFLCPLDIDIDISQPSSGRYGHYAYGTATSWDMTSPAYQTIKDKIDFIKWKKYCSNNINEIAELYS